MCRDNDKNLTVKETVRASEDFVIFLEDFYDYLNALEASIVTLKTQIAKLVGATDAEEDKKKPKFCWNPDAIKWEKAEGFKGSYERSEDVNNPEYKALVKELAQHGGRLTREGWFYWLFKNGYVVGRKQQEAKKRDD